MSTFRREEYKETAVYFKATMLWSSYYCYGYDI